MIDIAGLSPIPAPWQGDLLPLEGSCDGQWKTGVGGVGGIFTPKDRKVELICFESHTLVLVKSALGYPALYPLNPSHFEPPAETIMMDLDGTTVLSEDFWVWVIEQSTARLLGNPKFQLEEADIPHVSGHSVSEHLQYCLDKYCPEKNVEEARQHYFAITSYELSEIEAGRGRDDAFKPAPGLKDFLLETKGAGVKLGLVTSGLYEKAWPEILSVFRTMKLGDPTEFYDAIITAGFPLRGGKPGTLGELSPKPHPWLYAETARVGLGVGPERRHKAIGFEDSSAGVVSIRLAGFSAISVPHGNVAQSGVRPFVLRDSLSLEEALPFVLGR